MSELPNTKPALDLDALEREGGTPKPFDFVHEGKRYMLSDPQSIDWQDLIAAMRSPVLFLRMVMPPEDHVDFFRSKMPSWKMNALMKSYQDHYGLAGLGEATALPR